MFDQVVGAVFIGTGLYTWLLVRGVLPRRPKKPEEIQAWREQWGDKFRWVSPALVIYGLLRFSGVF